MQRFERVVRIVVLLVVALGLGVSVAALTWPKPAMAYCSSSC